MSLSDYFRAQADWRRHQADNQPDDLRHNRSAAALDELADYAEHEDAATLVAALEPFLIDDVLLGGESATRAVMGHGFDYTVSSTLEQIDFLDELVTLCLADAY